MLFSDAALIDALPEPPDEGRLLLLMCDVMGLLPMQAAQVIGWEGRFVHDLSKPTGMKQKLLDVGSQTAFGWQPQTSLQDGIAQTYAHFLEHHAQEAA